MNGITISTDYINRARTEIRRESIKELGRMQKDRYTFLNEIFFDRANELKNNQRMFHIIIRNNPDKPDTQIRAIIGLNQTTMLLANLYKILPMVCYTSVEARQRLLFNIQEEENTTTAAEEEVVYDADHPPPDNIDKSSGVYGEWCHKYNLEHPHCGCEYKF